MIFKHRGAHSSNIELKQYVPVDSLGCKPDWWANTDKAQEQHVRHDHFMQNHRFAKAARDFRNVPAD